ncbi:MotA/TolQ/ExbB proton channel family protein [Bowmanella sp. JS7-9]|uniref:MotA/TolQ/ExbB proton channel family protein n=1 Tax=Pseudobowmanella zhangzhouensis TaxID=1537679 RepID=A0ABW1XL08_9ALTE|nr:MotA/TolQ/ExbB proton channel family protein [Bowmanella sp. JS7-9]TBX19827.1 energy transducer TonB [Bowmanella sp. JS7-9]
MKNIVNRLVISLFAGAVALSAGAQETKPLDLDALLKQLEQGKFEQYKQNEAREREFTSQVAEQDAMLRDARARLTAQEKLSGQLETQSEENEIKVTNLKSALDERKGSLKELFGVLQQVAGDTRSKFANSMVSAQIPGRGEFLDKLAQSMGTGSQMASIEEIERVWFEIQREMTESGKVTRFDTEVVEADGTRHQKSVVRVGPLAMVADGKYLEFDGATGSVLELKRQPIDRYLDSAAALEASNGELVKFGMDPTGGSILGLLVQAPTLMERIDYGGLVGYIILAVGAVGLLLGLERMLTLFVVRQKVNKQLKSSVPSDNNPLGRVMKVRDAHPNADTEALELHLTEAILAEMPRLQRNLTLIKMISVVAPLMGLLGTVTGMIITFQQITLFGTGDPKLMAGGISTALVTTVQGLVVAIPMTLLYAMLSTRSKNIIHVLQEQAAGVIAERAERS